MRLSRPPPRNFRIRNIWFPPNADTVHVVCFCLLACVSDSSSKAQFPLTPWQLGGTYANPDRNCTNLRRCRAKSPMLQFSHEHLSHCKKRLFAKLRVKSTAFGGVGAVASSSGAVPHGVGLYGLQRVSPNPAQSASIKRSAGDFGLRAATLRGCFHESADYSHHEATSVCSAE